MLQQGHSGRTALKNLLNIFARNCSVRRIDAEVAAAFLDLNHRFGSAGCRYYYGLFVSRTTGADECSLKPGTLAGVAAFSGSRRLPQPDGKVIRSFEWVRYASLKGYRITGGMGKVLSAFIEDKHPDDVMTYSDPSSEDGGGVYRKLGFVSEGMIKKPEFSCEKFRLRLV